MRQSNSGEAPPAFIATRGGGGARSISAGRAATSHAPNSATAPPYLIGIVPVGAPSVPLPFTLLVS